MIRARFYTNSEDPRPVSWPIKHPYWITGFVDDATVIVAYVEDLGELKSLWPEAYGIEYTETEGYLFTSRFLKPEWLDAQSQQPTSS